MTSTPSQIVSLPDGNILRRHAEGYHFVGDPRTGMTARWGATMEQDPKQAPWPELVDISISNRCSKGCDFCYRDSQPDGPLMSLEDYRYLLAELTSPRWGPPFQVALGGGEPLEHPHILEILDATRAHGIVANFTTNGERLSEEMADALVSRVSAVALSAMGLSDFQPERARRLVSRGIRTNLHFILDDNTLHEALEIAEGKHDNRLQDLSGIVFLTRKPQGRSSPEHLLNFGTPLLSRFLDAVAAARSKIPLGFDACAVPLLLQHGQIDPRTIDACECGFFSVYVDESLEVRPCSFANKGEQGWSLKEHSFSSIWEHHFAAYRQQQLALSCSRECPGSQHCRGKCPFFADISFCFTSA